MSIIVYIKLIKLYIYSVCVIYILLIEYLILFVYLFTDLFNII